MKRRGRNFAKRLLAVMCIVTLLTSTLLMQAFAVEESDYTTYTLADFGFTDVTTIYSDTKNTYEPKTIGDGTATLDGCAIEGYYNFYGAAGTNYIFFGRNVWEGFFIASKGSDSIEFQYNSTKTSIDYGTLGSSGTLTTAAYNANNGDAPNLSNITGQDLKIRVEYDIEDTTVTSTTVTIKVIINDAYENTITISGANPVHNGQSIVPYAKMGYQFKIKPYQYETLTLTDFGHEEVVAVEKSNVNMQLSNSLNNYIVEGYYNFAQGVAGSSRLVFGNPAPSGNWTAINIAPWNEGTTLLVHYGQGASPGASNYTKILLSAYNAVSDEDMTSFYGQDFKMDVKFSFEDPTSSSTTVTLVITINDAYEQTITFTGVNASYMKGSVAIVSPVTGGTPVTATSIGTDVADITDISLQEELLIAPGRYDNSYNIDGQYLVYNGTTTATEKSLLNTELTQKITFSSHAGTQLYYAGDSATSGIKFETQSDGTIVMQAANGEFTGKYILSEAYAGTKLLGEEIKLTLKLYESGRNAKLAVYINGELYKNRPYVLVGAADKFGSNVRFTVTDSDAYVQIGNKNDAEYYNLAYGTPTEEEGKGKYTISGQGRVMVNGIHLGGTEDYLPDWLITTPGDYAISADATRVYDADYTKRVVLYYYGDSHVDGQTDVRDLIAIKKAEAGIELKTWSAEKGADANGDGTVNASDIEAIRKYVLESNEMQGIRDEAVYFDSSDVMPIVGNNGPYRTTDVYGNSYDFLTEDIYQAIKDVGINTLLTTGPYYTEPTADASDEDKAKIADYQDQLFKGLEMAEAYNLNVLLRDNRLGLTDDDHFRTFLTTFVKYSSFKGYNIIDEPYASYYCYSGTSDSTPYLEHYAGQSKVTNSYANTIGYVNLLRINESLNRESDTTSLLDIYDRYLEDYIQTHNPKLLCFDYYPFVNKSLVSDKETDRIAGYLENLSVLRAKAIDNSIPFWSYIQVGDNYSDTGKGISPTINGTPSRGQMLWNVNTSLAYGAKGIAYFTLIQPPTHSLTNNEDGTTSNDYARNGLIGAGAGLESENVGDYKNSWYYFAKDANKQVAEVDEVLMHAKSKEVLAVGSAATKTNNTLGTTDKEGVLKSITADVGAYVGVFNYQGKAAFYVVNDDMENAQTITLTFNEAKEYLVSSEQATSITKGETEYTLVLEAGGAALIYDVTGVDSYAAAELVDFLVDVETGKEPVVLQLTDPQIIDAAQNPDKTSMNLYWATNKMEERCYSYIRETIQETKPDLILITGDIIYGQFDNNGTALRSFIEFMDSFGIPWAPVFGNHDNESTMGVDWQCKQFENAKYCLFKQRELTGNGNYTVGIMQGGELKRVFFMLDSNGCDAASEESLANGHTVKTIGFGNDQIAWYTETAQNITTLSPETKFTFAFHIQLYVFKKAYEKYGFTNAYTDVNPINIYTHAAKEESDFGYLGRNMKDAWDTDYAVWNGLKALGVDSILVGHEHCNCASVVYDGVRFQYGQKSSTYDRANFLETDGDIVGMKGGDVGGMEDGTITCDSTTEENYSYGEYGNSLHNLKIEGYYNFAEKEADEYSTGFVCFGGENTSGSVFLGAWSDRDGTERLMLGRAKADMSGISAGEYANQYLPLKLSDYNTTEGAPYLDSFYGQDLKISVAFSFADQLSTNTTLTVTVTINDVFERTLEIADMDATASYFKGAMCVKSKSRPITLTCVESVMEDSTYTPLTFSDFLGGKRIPLMGGTVMKFSPENGAINNAYIYLCGNIDWDFYMKDE